MSDGAPDQAGYDNVFHTAGIGARKESAVMLGVLARHDPRREAEDPLAELEMLASTAEVRVLGRVVQRLDRPKAGTYAGKGTVERLANLARDTGADTIICDNDLSPAQLRNLERICERKVVDRTDLILDIFARHAKTLQARLQVELAQLEYARPRLRKMWTHLAGEQGGVGFRGPGEKQLEMDKRIIGKRIRELKDRLDEIRRRKVREVATRSEVYTVALVGYTNAGKSTLFSRLTDSEVYIADKLFATLDTKTRPFKVRSRVSAVLSDTVGFIDHLPHRLVESFHATLEEVFQADVLVHVVDVSAPDPLKQVESVNAVLAQIGEVNRPTVTALNKVDQAERESLPFFLKRLPNAVAISAKTGDGIPELRDAVAAELCRDDRWRRLLVPHDEGRFLAALDSFASELHKTAAEQGLIVEARVNDERLGHALRKARDRRRITVSEIAGPDPQ